MYFFKLLTLSVILLWGCHDSDQEDKSIRKTEKFVEQETKELTVVTMICEEGGISRVLERFVPEIKKEIHVDLKIKTVPFKDKYNLQLNDLKRIDSQYDLHLFWPTYTPDFAPYLLKLKEIGGEKRVIKDLQVADIHPSYRWTIQYAGDFYGIQVDGDTKLLHYRYDLANDPQEKETFKKKYGYELDMHQLTWERYYDVAEFFTRPEENFYGTAEITTFLVYFFFMDRLCGMGGHLFDYDNMTPLPDKEVTLKALQHGVDTFEKVSPPGAKEYFADDLYDQLWIKKRVFMVPFWPDGWRLANNPLTSNAVGKISVSEMPGFWRDGKIVFRPNQAGGRIIAINKASKVATAAYKVLVFLSDKKRSEYMVSDPLSWVDPWRSSHMKAELFYHLAGENKKLCQIYVDILSKSITDGYPELQITGTGDYHEIIESCVGKAWRKEISVEEAYQKMVQKMEAVTKKLGQKRQLKEWQRYVDNVLRPQGLYP